MNNAQLTAKLLRTHNSLSNHLAARGSHSLADARTALLVDRFEELREAATKEAWADYCAQSSSHTATTAYDLLA